MHTFKRKGHINLYIQNLEGEEKEGEEEEE
jgi:hypothetical protein